MTSTDTGSLVVKQLIAVKAQCDVLSAMVGFLLAEMTGGRTDAPAPAPAPAAPDPPAGDDTGEPGPCTHPLDRRVPLPVMGPKKFKCADCNQDVLEDQA